LWRISLYTELLSERAGLAANHVNDLRLGSTMHDLGKVDIPDHILLKRGRLTPAEYRVMQRHAEIGYRILSRSRSPMLHTAAEIAHTHHEWFDGSGYPKHLAGEKIPLAGRIVAIGDVFDALTTPRPYKQAMAPELARAYMEDLRGRQFDPALLDLFIDAWPEVRAIHDAQVETA
jgi:putative two-component system response regulator